MIYEFALAQPCAAPYPHEHIHSSMHRLRHMLYRQRVKWNVPEHMGMEFDEYDTLRARYLVGIDKTGQVRCQTRMITCDHPYMLADLWPDLSPDRALPDTAQAAEGSRTGIDLTMPMDQQRRWYGELLVANVEWALLYGVERVNFVTYEQVAKKSLERAGLPIHYYGPAKPFPEGEFIAGYFPATQGSVDHLRELYGIEGKSFTPLPEAGVDGVSHVA